MKTLALDHPAWKWWFVRPQSQDHLNILLNVRPSRFPPEYSEESGELDTSSPASPGSLKARSHLQDPSLAGNGAICPPGRKAPRAPLSHPPVAVTASHMWQLSRQEGAQMLFISSGHW